MRHCDEQTVILISRYSNYAPLRSMLQDAPDHDPQYSLGGSVVTGPPLAGDPGVGWFASGGGFGGGGRVGLGLRCNKQGVVIMIIILTLGFSILPSAAEF